MKCPKCGNIEYDKRIVLCSNCGTKLQKDLSDKKGIPISTIVMACIGIILIMLSIFVVTYLDKKDKPELFNHISNINNSIPVIKANEIKPLSMDIIQLDNADFPRIKYYANIMGENNAGMEGLNKDDFKMFEDYSDGTESEVQIEDIYKIPYSEDVSINFVIDKSDSMNEAKSAVKDFLSEIKSQNSNYVAITSFDSYVYSNQTFTNDLSDLYTAIDNIYPNSGTAFYDALCAALNSTSFQKGAKCVIAFTDGNNIDNESSYTYDDVVKMCNSTGIPLYIIGIGDESKFIDLKDLTSKCNGKFISANTENLSEALANIYSNIYKMQRNLYEVTYISPNKNDANISRTIRLIADENQGYTGMTSRKYIPNPVDNIFNDDYSKKDYILGKSSSEHVAKSDLTGLSLAELRIARNEIFARHGRLFRDSFLNKWFYSKQWYLNIPLKYSPPEFDSMQSPLSMIEIENTDFILAYENEIMNNSLIFPNISYKLLSEYDVSLDKPVLVRSLEEFYNGKGLNYGQMDS
ncbi:MAG: YARHG domain-containing protein, partial [Oscillospiraceae bacterium]|nr:YARHG domain-containing protein [Oscillospiraceae bacterium]